MILANYVEDRACCQLSRQEAKNTFLIRAVVEDANLLRYGVSGFDIKFL